MSDRTWMSRAEAAKYLGISVRKLDILRKQGEIRASQLGEPGKPGVLVRYAKRDLDSFMEHYRVSPQCDDSGIQEKAKEILRSS